MSDTADWAVTEMTEAIVERWTHGRYTPAQVQDLVDVMSHRRQADIAQAIANGLRRELAGYVRRQGLCGRCLRDGGCDCRGGVSHAVGGTCHE